MSQHDKNERDESPQQFVARLMSEGSKTAPDAEWIDAYLAWTLSDSGADSSRHDDLGRKAA